MLSGDTLDTSSLRGEVVVFNVWGSWCVPCATEAPDLVKVANELDTQVVFVGINVRDNEAAARAFEREYAVPYDSVVAQDSSRAMLSFAGALRSEEHTSELQSLMRISYAVFCLNKKTQNKSTR